MSLQDIKIEKSTFSLKLEKMRSSILLIKCDTVMEREGMCVGKLMFKLKMYITFLYIHFMLILTRIKIYRINIRRTVSVIFAQV